MKGPVLIVEDEEKAAEILRLYIFAGLFLVRVGNGLLMAQT
jgi:hypothetical protein